MAWIILSIIIGLTASIWFISGPRYAGTFFGLAFFIALIASWFTHVIHTLSNGEWGFLIAGALVFPIAIIHGIGIWFGFF